MDKISKALKKLSSQEKKIAKLILENIAKNDFKNLDIKKLKGHDNIFRARKGKIRIIYKTNKDNSVFILTIERRSDKTYKF